MHGNEFVENYSAENYAGSTQEECIVGQQGHDRTQRNI